MSQQTYKCDQSYQGIGRVWVRKSGTTGIRRFLSNCSKANIKQKLKVNKVPDYTRIGGGTRAQFERIDSISLALTLHELSAENLALAVGSNSTAVASATVTSEPVSLYKGGAVPLEFLPASITSVTVTSGSVVLTAGTDYEMTPAGLYIPSDAPHVSGSGPVAATVTYVSKAHQEMQAGTVLSTDLELMIEGLNDLDGRPLVVDVWKLHVPVLEDLALIADKPTEITYEAELLRDATKPDGESGFYRVRFGDLAA